jgi:hypothetical protein
MDAYAGESASLIFQFLVDGEFVTPASATFSVRDNTGSILTSGVSITLGPSDTQTVVPLESGWQTIGGGLNFEVRTVEVLFVYEGNTFRLREGYRVIPWLNYNCTTHDVRRELGIMDYELTDEEIDFPLAYFKICDRVTSATLAAALSAGNTTAMYANQAIYCRAALDLTSMLQLRVMNAMQDDNQNLTRNDPADFSGFDALIQAITDDYEEGIDGLQPLVAPTDLIQFTTSLPVDVITNSALPPMTPTVAP